MMKPLFCLLLLCTSAFAQTTISDKFPLGAGALPWYKSLLISWPAYLTPQAHRVAAGTQTVTIAPDGSFSIQLAPGDTAVPAFQYTVQMYLQDGSTGAPTSWFVPTTSLTLGRLQVEVPQPGSKSGVVLTQLRCAACKTGDIPSFNGLQFEPVNVAAFDQAGSSGSVLASSAQKAANLSDLANPATALANLGGITAVQASAIAPVQSVAGRNGIISLSIADIAGLGSAATEDASAFDLSGAAAAAQANALSSSMQKGANLSDVASPSAALANLGGITAAQVAGAAPVQSVAGRSGAISLSASDIAGLGTAATHAATDFDLSGAAASAQAASTQKSANLADVANPTAALTNLHGVTSAQAAAAAPVQSVAGRSGTIALSTSDIAGLGTAATHQVADFDLSGAAAAAQAASTQRAANLADVANPAAALTNLHGVTSAQAAAAAPVQTVAGIAPSGGNIPVASTNLSDTGTLVRSSTTTMQSFSGPITAPQSNSVFNVDGFPASGCTLNGTAYTTQLDCANATANAWIAANAQSATLFFGNSGVYTTCTGVSLPATGVSIASLSLIGQGRGWQHGAKSATQIKQTCPVATAVVSKAAGTTTYLYPALTINNIDINANNLAPSCLDLYGVSGDYQNISCFGISGSDHFIKIGDNATAQGGAYEVFARNIKVDGGAYGAGGSGAAFAASLNAGAISGFTILQGISAIAVNNGGSGYALNATITFNGGTCTLAPQAFVSSVGPGGVIYGITVAQSGACSVAPTSINITGGSGAATSLTSVNQTGGGYSAYARVALYGYGASLNQTQPCTTMPTNPVAIATDGAGHVTGLSLLDSTVASTGSGCTGTVDVQVQDVYPSSYGIVINSTDSDYDNVVVQKAGQVAGIVVNHSQNTFKHPHCYGSQPICIQDWGGNDYTAIEGDVVAHYTIDLEGMATTVRGAKAFANAYVYLPGMAKYYISPAATNLSISEASTLTGPVQPDEHTFVAIGGVLDTVTATGTSTFVSGASMPSSDDLQTNSFRIMAQSVVDGPGGGSYSFFNGSLVIGNKLGKFGDSSGSQFVPGSTTTASAMQRNSADAVAGLQIQQKNTGSTGNIVDFQNPSGTVSSIDFNGALTIATAVTQPACNVAARGKLWIARGTPDHLQVCIQTSTSGTYAWQQIF